MERRPGERRQDTRFGGAVTAGLRGTLRPGCAVTIVDLSAGGALVEAPRQLRPGARVHLQLTTASEAIALAARVLRCAVWLLEQDGGIVYRGALQFDERRESLWVGSAHEGNVVPERPPSLTAERGNELPDAVGSRPDGPGRSPK